VKFIADASARAFAIERGEVDLAADNPIPPSQLARFSKLPGIEIEKRGYGFLGSQTQVELNLRNPILQKLEVRQAIALVLDLDEIKNKACYGYAQSSPTPITVLDTQNHNPAIKPRKPDPARARQLLDRAGYLVGSDGTRFNLRLVYNPYNDGYRRVAEIVRQSLATIGIQAKIIPNDFAGYMKTVYTDGAFDLNAATHVNLYDPSVGVQRIYWSKNIKQGVPFSNASHYSNPKVDELAAISRHHHGPGKEKSFVLQVSGNHRPRIACYQLADGRLGDGWQGQGEELHRKRIRWPRQLCQCLSGVRPKLDHQPLRHWQSPLLGSSHATRAHHH